MLAGFRGWEWIIILVIVVLVFGVGRISKLGGELGQGIRSFREGLKTDDKAEETPEEDSKEKSEEKPKKKKKKKKDNAEASVSEE